MDKAGEEEREGEINGERGMDAHIPTNINSQWEFAVFLRELKPGLCNNLEGWDGERGGRQVKREGPYVYLWLIYLMFGRNQHNTVKQLSFN